jgi:hypothetical protein
MNEIIAFLTSPVGGVETVNAVMGWDDAIYMLIVMAVSTALSMVLAPKPPRPPDAELQTQDTPRNDPSKYLGVAFGRVRTKDAIVGWSGNKKAVPIMSDQRGKK